MKETAWKNQTGRNCFRLSRFQVLGNCTNEWISPPQVDATSIGGAEKLEWTGPHPMLTQSAVTQSLILTVQTLGPTAKQRKVLPSELCL